MSIILIELKGAQQVIILGGENAEGVLADGHEVVAVGEARDQDLIVFLDAVFCDDTFSGGIFGGDACS